jgi:sugar diacid utilization regulator
MRDSCKKSSQTKHLVKRRQEYKEKETPLEWGKEEKTSTTLKNSTEQALPSL